MSTESGARLAQGGRPEAWSIEPRIKERRIAVRRSQGRRRLMIVLAMVTVAATSVAAIVVLRSPLFEVRNIAVVGARQTQRSAIVAVAGLSKRPLMVDVDTSTIEHRLEALPWVKSAVVSKDWPSTIDMRVSERTPVAQVSLPGRHWALVDGTGRVLAVVGAREPGIATLGGVASAVGPGGRLGAAEMEALGLAKAVPVDLRASVGSIGYTAGQLVITLAGSSTTVELGSATALDAKFDALRTVLQRVGAGGVRVIDVRVPSDPALTRG